MLYSRRRLFWSVSLGHTVIDMFNGMGPVLLTFLSGHVLSMTNTQIGFAVSAYQLFSGVSQPFFGYAADKSGGRWIGAGGLTWTVVWLVISLLMATTGQYLLMVIPFVLAAFGSGAFHPVGSMHAAESNQSRAAVNLSIFFFMGQTGGGLGPAIAGFLLDRYATHNAVFTQALGPALSGRLAESGTVSPVVAMSLIALPAVAWMALSIPNRRAYHEHRQASHNAPNAQRLPVSRRMGALLITMIGLRSLANPGSVSFLPALFALKGWSASEYGLITSMFWIAGGTAGIVCGRLAERYGNRAIISTTLMLASAPIFLLAIVETQVAFVLALAAGACTGASHSLLVVMAQRLMPARKGLASGATLGFIFGAGALATMLIGTLSDHVSLPTVYQIIGIVTLITGVLALGLPEERRPASAPTPESMQGTKSAEPVEIPL